MIYVIRGKDILLGSSFHSANDRMKKEIIRAVLSPENVVTLEG
jgi:hypothetical protein